MGQSTRLQLPLLKRSHMLLLIAELCGARPTTCSVNSTVRAGRSASTRKCQVYWLQTTYRCPQKIVIWSCSLHTMLFSAQFVSHHLRRFQLISIPGTIVSYTNRLPK